jgi:hypothetical protein
MEDSVKREGGNL